MYMSCKLLLAALLFTLGQARSAEECSDPAGIEGITPECFQALDISGAIADYVQGASRNGNCEHSFAQCFLGSIHRNSGNCSVIAESSCSQPQWADYKASGISVENFYIAYNIYAIWAFFNSYYQAVGDAQSLASSSVGSITTTFNVKEKESPLGDILTAIGSVISIGLSNAKIYQALNAILQVVSGLKLALAPGSDESNLIQWGQLDTQLADTTIAWKAQIAAALGNLTIDAPTFINATASGVFSQGNVVTIPKLESSSLSYLNAYVVSQSLGFNQWQVVKVPDFDIHVNVSGYGRGGPGNTDQGVDIYYGVGCFDKYDDKGFCGGWWYDAEQKTSYSLTSDRSMSNDPGPIMKSIAQATTGKAMFRGAKDCGGGQPGVVVENDQVIPKCFSSGKVCRW